MSKIFTYELQVLERHLDVYGHVNNKHYLEMFEEARWDMVTQQGWGLERVLHQQTGPVILGLEIQFIKELRLHARIAIKTWCKGYTRVVGTLVQEMWALDGHGSTFGHELPHGQLHCTAEIRMALFDLKRRKILRPTDEWLRIFGVSPTE